MIVSTSQGLVRTKLFKVENAPRSSWHIESTWSVIITDTNYLYVGDKRHLREREPGWDQCGLSTQGFRGDTSIQSAVHTIGGWISWEREALRKEQDIAREPWSTASAWGREEWFCAHWACHLVLFLGQHHWTQCGAQWGTAWAANKKDIFLWNAGKWRAQAVLVW